MGIRQSSEKRAASGHREESPSASRPAPAPHRWLSRDPSSKSRWAVGNDGGRRSPSDIVFEELPRHTQTDPGALAPRGGRTYDVVGNWGGTRSAGDIVFEELYGGGRQGEGKGGVAAKGGLPLQSVGPTGAPMVGVFCPDINTPRNPRRDKAAQIEDWRNASSQRQTGSVFRADIAGSGDGGTTTSIKRDFFQPQQMLPDGLLFCEESTPRDCLKPVNKCVSATPHEPPLMHQSSATSSAESDTDDSDDTGNETGDAADDSARHAPNRVSQPVSDAGPSLSPKHTYGRPASLRMEDRVVDLGAFHRRKQGADSTKPAAPNGLSAAHPAEAPAQILQRPSDNHLYALYEQQRQQLPWNPRRPAAPLGHVQVRAVSEPPLLETPHLHTASGSALHRTPTPDPPATYMRTWRGTYARVTHSTAPGLASPAERWATTVSGKRLALASPRPSARAGDPRLRHRLASPCPDAAYEADCSLPTQGLDASLCAKSVRVESGAVVSVGTPAATDRTRVTSVTNEDCGYDSPIPVHLRGAVQRIQDAEGRCANRQPPDGSSHDPLMSAQELSTNKSTFIRHGSEPPSSCTTPKLPAGTAQCAADQRIPEASAFPSEMSGLNVAAWEPAPEMPEPGCRSQHEGHRAVWLRPSGGGTADLSRMGDMKEPVNAPSLGGCRGSVTSAGQGASEPRRLAQRLEPVAPTTTPLGPDSRVGQSQVSGWADTGTVTESKPEEAASRMQKKSGWHLRHAPPGTAVEVWQKNGTDPQSISRSPTRSNQPHTMAVVSAADKQAAEHPTDSVNKVIYLTSTPNHASSRDAMLLEGGGRCLHPSTPISHE